MAMEATNGTKRCEIHFQTIYVLSDAKVRSPKKTLIKPPRSR